MFTITSTCKGGGYSYCRTEPPHPNRNAKGLYPLHRVLMENKIGRLLERDEHVHHKDEDKTNDTIENLELLSASEHTKRHHPRIALEEVHCPCGAVFQLKPSVARARRKATRSTLHCSKECSRNYSERK